MPPKRSSSRVQQPAQRRPRTEKACSFCRKAKQRCEPTEYGTNDRPCRRCVSQGLECNLPRVARSQSPSSGFGAQVPAPIQHAIPPHSTGGVTEELTPGSGTNVPYTLQQPESARTSMGSWSPLMVHPGGSSTSIHPSGQTPVQTPSFLPAAPGMADYQQSFPNVAQDFYNPEPPYYTQDYVGPTPRNTYVTSYAHHRVGEGVSNPGYTLEDAQADIADASANEEDARLSRSCES